MQGSAFGLQPVPPGSDNKHHAHWIVGGGECQAKIRQNILIYIRNTGLEWSEMGYIT